MRYFQAWVEAAPVRGQGGGEEEDSDEEEEDDTSELGAWGGPSLSGTTTGTGTGTGSRLIVGVGGGAVAAGAGSGDGGGAGGRQLRAGGVWLATVVEASREGRVSTPSRNGEEEEEEEEDSASGLSASFGNLAVASGKRMLSTMDSSRELRQRRSAAASDATGAGSTSFVFDDSPPSSPRHGRPRSPRHGGGDAASASTTTGTATTGTATTSGPGGGGTSSTEGFTFDRSHVHAAGGVGVGGAQGAADGLRSSSRRSRRSKGSSLRLRQLLYIQMEVGRGGRALPGACCARAGEVDFALQPSQARSRLCSAAVEQIRNCPPPCCSQCHPTHCTEPPVARRLPAPAQFCPRTLRGVLDLGAVEEADRWRVLRQILAGLAHIHAQGIIHRDLKPAVRACTAALSWSSGLLVLQLGTQGTGTSPWHACTALWARARGALGSPCLSPGHLGLPGNPWGLSRWWTTYGPTIPIPGCLWPWLSESWGRLGGRMAAGIKRMALARPGLRRGRGGADS